MSPLEAQKRLLIAESELNRANLADGLAGLGSGVAAMVDGATRVETLCSALVTVLSGVLEIGRTTAPGAGKPSLLSSVITGGRLFASLWKTFRS